MSFHSGGTPGHPVQSGRCFLATSSSLWGPVSTYLLGPLSPLPFNPAFQLSPWCLETQLALTAVHAELIYLAGVALRQGRGRLNGEAVKKLIAWWTAVTVEPLLFASSNHICYQGFFLFAPFLLFELEEYQVYSRDELGWLAPKPLSLACRSLHLLKGSNSVAAVSVSLFSHRGLGSFELAKISVQSSVFVLLVLMKSLIPKWRAGSFWG